MLTEKYQQIKQLTFQIAKCVDDFKIEECNRCLQERQLLLEECYSAVQNSIEHGLKEEFISLLQWLSTQDEIPHDKSMILKNDYQTKLSTQKKAKFAIKQYKNFT